jgi:hypothetical protein
MTDKEAFVEFRNGAVFVLAVLVGPALLAALFFSGEPQSVKKFEVVDTYRTCDVVRYTDRSNNWHYFLDCPKGG